MKRRTACGLLALGALSRLRGQDATKLDPTWEEETKSGLAALEQGYIKKAQDDLTRALDQAKAAKADDLVIASCIDNLALATELKGHEREKLYRQSLKIREQRLKPDDPEIARSLAHVASTLYDFSNLSGSDLAEAEKLLDRAMKIAEVDPQSELVAQVLETRGTLRHHQYPLSKLLDNVEPLYRRALSILVNHASKDDLNFARVSELTSILLRETGRVDEADLLARRASPIRQRHIQNLSPVPPGNARPNLSGALRIGNSVTSPVLLNKIEPTYSDLARQVKWQGDVNLQVVVGESGSVDSIALTRSLGLGLDEQALFAVREWTFRPGQRENMPVRVIANIAVNFRLL